MKVIVHPGLHKTGTTFLQDHIFNTLKGVSHAKYGGFKKTFLKEDNLLISNESLSGNPFYPKNLDYLTQIEDNFIKLNRVFYHPYLVIGYREPSDWLNSVYKQYLQVGGILSIDEYLESLKNVINFEDFFVGQIHEIAIKYFPHDKIFAYDYSELKDNPIDFTNELIEFINPSDSIHNYDFDFSVKSNRSLPDQLEWMMIAFNKIEENRNIGFIVKTMKKLRVPPRKIIQQILPRFLNSSGRRELTNIKELHRKEWNRFVKKIKNERKNSLRQATNYKGGYSSRS